MSLKGLLGLPERGIRAFDDFQQRHRWLGQPIGTIRKYGDDRGGALAGLVTYQVFLGLLPLLVVALTVFGRLLEGSDRIRDAVLESALVQFPVIGSRIQNDVSALTVTGPWLYLAILGLVLTSFGIYHGLQLALNQVWNVTGVYRQGFVNRYLSALLLYIMLFVAAIGTSLWSEVPFLQWGDGVLPRIGEELLGLTVASLLLLGVFRLVTSRVVSTRSLVPAAILAGFLWELLQRAGTWIVADRLSQAEDLYGAIGLVVVALFWINLLAQSAILANEFAVVAERRLWPRRITQPPLSDADKQVLIALLRNEHRRPEQQIHVTFDDDPVGVVLRARKGKDGKPTTQLDAVEERAVDQGAAQPASTQSAATDAEATEGAGPGREAQSDREADADGEADAERTARIDVGTDTASGAADDTAIERASDVASGSASDAVARERRAAADDADGEAGSGRGARGGVHSTTKDGGT